MFLFLVAAASAAFTVVVSALTSFAASAVAAVTVASAASATMYIFAVKALCKFLLGRFAYCKYLTLEMEGLAGHLVVEVHLYSISSNFHYYTWNNAAHAVHHR